MKKTSMILSALCLLLTLNLSLKAQANTDEFADFTEAEEPLTANLVDDDTVIEDEAYEILDDEEEYRQWLEDLEDATAPTAYVDEYGNEYYFPQGDVASNTKTKLKKRSGPKAQLRTCSLSNGDASWYGPGFHGKKTGSGEKFNQDAFTAAHKTLKYGSVVLVTYKGRSVKVRINDAGPYHKGRVIDLSKAAAEKIGLIGPGSGPVTLKLLSCG